MDPTSAVSLLISILALTMDFGSVPAL
ncbi:hypothetical protein BVRB_034590, partial [Beta vulgaris subsp. vulgaris]